MTALRWRWLLSLVASVGVVLGLAGAAPGQPQGSGTGYAAQLLPVPAGFTAAEPRAVNNHGVVVGVADGRPVKWVDGQVSVLPMPEGFTGAAAQSVNDRGVIAGTGVPGPDQYPVPIVWHRDGSVQILPVLKDHHQPAGVLIDNRGDLFGTLVNDWYESVAVVWRRGIPELLPAPPPFTATGVRAVNNPGVALGSYGDPEQTWWVTWRGDTIMPLPSPTTFSVDPWAINDRGVVVGRANFTPSLSHPVVWRGTTWQVLPLPSTMRSGLATAVNIYGHVAGRAYHPPGGAGSGLLWRDGEVHLLHPPPGSCCAHVYDMNDSGVVVGVGSSQSSVQGVLWSTGTDTNQSTKGHEPGA